VRYRNDIITKKRKFNQFQEYIHQQTSNIDYDPLNYYTRTIIIQQQAERRKIRKNSKQKS